MSGALKRATESFPKLDAPRIMVSKKVHENLSYLEKDADESTLKNADQIIKNFDDMEDVSSEVFVLLDKMLKE